MPAVLNSHRLDSKHFVLVKNEDQICEDCATESESEDENTSEEEALFAY